MKKDFISILLAFFKLYDKNLLKNPEQLKKLFLETNGDDYLQEISDFCRILNSDITRKINTFDIDSIISYANELHRQNQVNLYTSVIFLGCYLYLNKSISIETLKILISKKNEIKQENIIEREQNVPVDSYGTFTSHKTQDHVNDKNLKHQIKKDTDSLKETGNEAKIISWIAIICAALSSASIIAKELGFLFTFILSILAIILGSKAKRFEGKDGKRGFCAWILGIIFTVVNAIRLAIGLYVLWQAYRLFSLFR